MAKVNPASKAGRHRKGKSLIVALLRSPKTRSGLIAAAALEGLSRNYVYGFLASSLRVGFVLELKSTNPPTYQLADTAAQELPKLGVYPSWLEPRLLPAFTGRRAFIDGDRVVEIEKEDK